MKKISIIVPCYNEEKSIMILYEKIQDLFRDRLSGYDYEIIFADDFSEDRTRAIIKEICQKDKHAKAVFNAANFGFSRNIFSALCLMSGDAAFLLFGDLQDPPELLPDFIQSWEAGNRVIIGQKKGSRENIIMSIMRKLYYTFIKLFSEKTQINNFNGYGLYDSSFIDILRQVDDMQPYLKQVIAEYSPGYHIIPYTQNKSRRGKSNFSFYKNYDFAMDGITSSTKKLMRLSTLVGVILGVACAIYAVVVLIQKLINWDAYPFGLASITVAIFFIGAMQLFFIGVLGEYILSINNKTLRRPRVVIDEKINFAAGENSPTSA